MCETGYNNMTFTTVEQKIAWEYLEVYHFPELKKLLHCVKLTFTT